jgi:hypothetical protein
VRNKKQDYEYERKKIISNKKKYFQAAVLKAALFFLF